MLVKDAFDLTKTLGDLGIEIEVEGSNLPPGDMPSKFWRVEVDSSLRGENREFVYKKPLPIDLVPASLDELNTFFSNYNSEVDYTHRAGIHVHVNVQDLTLKQLVTFITLFCIYEESFINFCSQVRHKNHFCLSTSDAVYATEVLKKTISLGNVAYLATDDIRYCSINLTSLHKYGSVEFRSLESTGDHDKIYTWCKLLLKLRDYAKTVNIPTDLFEQASGAGQEEFTKEVFGEMFPVINPLVTYDTFYNGMRNIQHAIYTIDWNNKNLNIFSQQKNIFSAS